jgi:hypothetical protein
MFILHRSNRIFILFLTTVLSMAAKVASFTTFSSTTYTTLSFTKVSSSVHILKGSNDPISEIINKIPNFPFLQNNEEDKKVDEVVEKNSIDDPEKILASLGMKSSTEPKVAYVDPERYFDIATAAMPVSLEYFSSCF